jgi:uncharacterized protein YndB with AHSA1/START domain
MTLSRLDPKHPTVSTAVDIAAPPERVFHALTDPEDLAAWWVAPGPAGGAGSHAWRVDVRPGGGWSVQTTDAAGRVATARGEYRVVDPPRVLEFTWEASWDRFVTTVRIELEPVAVDGAPGTRLRVTHTGPRGATASAADAHPSAAWAGIVASLARHTVQPAAPGAGVHRPWAPGDALPYRVQVVARPARALEVVA